MTVLRIVTNISTPDPKAAQTFYGDILDLDLAMDMGWIRTYTASSEMNPQISVAPDTAWMVNKLLFTDIYFYDLTLQMQRRYDVVIYFRNEKAKSYRFAGRFEDEDIDVLTMDPIKASQFQIGDFMMPARLFPKLSSTW